MGDVRQHQGGGPVLPDAEEERLPTGAQTGVGGTLPWPATGSGEAVQAVCLDEFAGLGRDGALACVRELRSLGYSVSLLFHAGSPAWYVASWQDGTVWRVVHCVSCDTAQAVLAHLAGEIVQLCEPELRRTELQARNAHLGALAEQAEAEVERLRGSLQRAATQAQLAAARQQKTRRELVRLDSQRIAVQAQLTQTQRQATQLRQAASASCAPPPRFPSISK